MRKYLRGWKPPLLVAAALLIGASALLMTEGTRASAAKEWDAQIGGGDAGITVNVFSPSSIAVNVGDTVKWTNPFTQPHSIAYVTGGGTIQDETAAQNAQAAAAFDGTQTFSSGLFAPGSRTFNNANQFSVTFKSAGQYTFFCTIHPGMEVTVTVLNSGNPPAIDQGRIKTRVDQGIALGKAAADALKVPGPTANANGTQTWNVPTPPTFSYAGGSVDVLRYKPVEVDIGVGDTVTWNNTSDTPHTVTFLPGPPPAGFSPFVPAVTSTHYTQGTFLNSGIIGDFPGAVGTSFSLTFDKPGTYQYICALHADSGMVGVIVVGGGGSGGITPPSTGSAGLLDQSSGSWLMIAGLIVLISGLAGAAMVVRRGA